MSGCMYICIYTSCRSNGDTIPVKNEFFFNKQSLNWRHFVHTQIERMRTRKRKRQRIDRGGHRDL